MKIILLGSNNNIWDLCKTIIMLNKSRVSKQRIKILQEIKYNNR